MLLMSNKNKKGSRLLSCKTPEADGEKYRIGELNKKRKITYHILLRSYVSKEDRANAFEIRI